jgi:hypothetical protein
MNGALDRNALYYPYIHFRDLNWLKATLLCFPQVRRIVPARFALNDSPDVQEFTKLKGPSGQPLVLEEPAYSGAAYEAQRRLTQRLKNVPQVSLAGFTRRRTEQAYPENPEVFQIHRGKMDELLELLRGAKLAWPARVGRGLNERDWFAMHPKLGEAVMSTIAIAIASEHGLDIVTSSGTVHRALACLDEEAIFQNLTSSVRKSHIARENATPQIVDELSQVVMLTTFDFRKLSPAQIGELVKDGKGLRRFKDGLVKIASRIPDIPDPPERQLKLREAAKQVAEEWEDYRKSLPKFVLEALVSAAEYKMPEIIGGILAGATSCAVLTAGSGLAIGLATFAGVKIWNAYKEKANSPYQYLSKIAKQGALLSSRAEAVQS